MAKNEKGAATRRYPNGVSKAQLNKLNAKLERSNARVKILSAVISKILTNLGLDKHGNASNANRDNEPQRGGSV